MEDNLQQLANSAPPTAHGVEPHSESEDSVCHRVFNTPELLENIISLLPLRNILSNAQRVSRTWRDSVGCSPSIQKRLWMRSLSPASSPVGFVNVFFSYGAMRNNARALRFPGELAAYAAEVKPNALVFTPLPADARRSTTGKNPRTRLSISGRGRLSTARARHTMNLNVKRLSDIAGRPSWLKMYLTEPPITTVLMRAVRLLPRTTSLNESAVVIREKSGLTFEVLKEVVEKFVSSLDDSILMSCRHTTLEIEFMIKGVRLGDTNSDESPSRD